jgi:hypothetical protein
VTPDLAAVMRRCQHHHRSAISRRLAAQAARARYPDRAALLSARSRYLWSRHFNPAVSGEQPRFFARLVGVVRGIHPKSGSPQTVLILRSFAFEQRHELCRVDLRKCEQILAICGKLSWVGLYKYANDRSIIACQQQPKENCPMTHRMRVNTAVPQPL